jgi:hypothetical protein
MRALPQGIPPEQEIRRDITGQLTQAFEKVTEFNESGQFNGPVQRAPAKNIPIDVLETSRYLLET